MPNMMLIPGMRASFSQAPRARLATLREGVILVYQSHMPDTSCLLGVETGEGVGSSDHLKHLHPSCLHLPRGSSYRSFL